MSNYFTGYANGSMNLFRGETKQEAMTGREDFVVFQKKTKVETSWTMMYLEEKVKRSRDEIVQSTDDLLKGCWKVQAGRTRRSKGTSQKGQVGVRARY